MARLSDDSSPRTSASNDAAQPNVVQDVDRRPYSPPVLHELDLLQCTNFSTAGAFDGSVAS